MKNTIFVGIENDTEISVNGTIPLQLVERKYNRCGANSKVDLVGNAVTISANSKGVRPRYNLFARVTFTSSAAGDVVLAIYQDGNVVPLTTVTETVTTADTEVRTVTIPASILTKICASTTITIVNLSVAPITVTSASLLVEEV